MKDTKALVLNSDYTPISILPSTRAFVIHLKGHADIIYNYPPEERVLHGAKKNYPAPSVIRINERAKVPYRKVPLTKHNIYKRDNYTCVYCGTTDDLSIDHVIPRSKGGKDTWENLATACKTCNSKKGDILLKDIPIAVDGEIKLYRPHYLLMMSKHVNDKVRDEWKDFLFMN